MFAVVYNFKCSMAKNIIAFLIEYVGGGENPFLLNLYKLFQLFLEQKHNYVNFNTVAKAL